VPQFAAHPTDARDEAVGLDALEHLTGFGIDLVDLARAVFSDPQQPFGPRQAGGASARRSIWEWVSGT
jgi:hypothetical protein